MYASCVQLVSTLPTREKLRQKNLTVADSVARQYPGITVDYVMPQDFVNAVRDVAGVYLPGQCVWA